jgi:hypothetical protein
MFYKQKPKTYPGRGFVRAIEAMLVIAVVLVATNAVIDRFTPEENRSANVDVVRTEVMPFVQQEQAHVIPSGLSVYEYYNTALDYHLDDEYERAIQYYSAAIETNDSYAVPFLNRGVAYEQLQDSYRSMHDLHTYIEKNSGLVLTRLDYSPGETVTVEMAEGRVYRMPFTAEAGQKIRVSAMGQGDEIVDPLVVVVDKYNQPVVSNDDIIVNGNLMSMSSYIDSFTIPTHANCYGRSNEYTLIVSHAGGGSNGLIDVTLDVMN